MWCMNHEAFSKICPNEFFLCKLPDEVLWHMTGWGSLKSFFFQCKKGSPLVEFTMTSTPCATEHLPSDWQGRSDLKNHFLNSQHSNAFFKHKLTFDNIANGTLCTFELTLVPIIRQVFLIRHCIYSRHTTAKPNRVNCSPATCFRNNLFVQLQKISH